MYKVCFRDWNVNEVEYFDNEKEALNFAEEIWMSGYMICQVYDDNNEILVEYEN